MVAQLVNASVQVSLVQQFVDPGIGVVVEWSRHSAHDREVVGSNLVGTTYRKSTVNSAVHPYEVGK